MPITKVEQPEEFKKELKTALTGFMEQNKPFNVQGSWTKNGLTVSVLVDFGIQDRDDGDYYIGSVSASYEDNYNLLSDEEAEQLKELDCTPEREQELMEKLKEKIAEHDAFIEAGNQIKRAVKQVFNVPYMGMRGDVHCSDIDVCDSYAIDYSNWSTREKISFERDGEVQKVY